MTGLVYSLSAYLHTEAQALWKERPIRIVLQNDEVSWESLS